MLSNPLMSGTCARLAAQAAAGHVGDLLPLMMEPYVENVNAFMLDIAWHMQGTLKGLTLRNRLGYEHGPAAWGGHYLDDRTMLRYAF